MPKAELTTSFTSQIRSLFRYLDTAVSRQGKLRFRLGAIDLVLPTNTLFGRHMHNLGGIQHSLNPVHKGMARLGFHIQLQSLQFSALSLKACHAFKPREALWATSRLIGRP